MVAVIADELGGVEGKGLAEYGIGAVKAAGVGGSASDALTLEIEIACNTGAGIIGQFHEVVGGTVSADGLIESVTLVAHEVSAGLAKN